MPLPIRAAGIDVDLEHLARPALEIEREVAAARLVKRVREAMRLDGLKALEEEQRVDRPVAGGIALEGRGEIRACLDADLRPEIESVVKRLPDQVGGNVGMIEPLGQAMGERRFETVVVENVRDDEGRKRRLVRANLARIGLDGGPDRVNGRDDTWIFGCAPSCASPSWTTDIRHRVPRNKG